MPIYAAFHPTIKIMDEGIDRAGAAAMTGLELSGWRNRGSEAPDASETQ